MGYRVTFILPDHDYELLDAYAKCKSRSSSQLVREMVQTYIHKNGGRMLKAVKDEKKVDRGHVQNV